ncbi:DNA polymerase domain-containing protein [Fodinicola feengrottensis]|uniref:Non-homologous end-joining DNA ligase n=1 Tax=Fodinicola feengrottensis TaxID=435914 RepID=A0ABN2J3K5_9ACTN|nr:DNA polymerase domain-containing protein [Fodinicola feengrottensis]
MPATPAEEIEVDGHDIRLSNPDKVYFPDLGSEHGTKRHLFDYYVSVGDGIVRALRDRPTYLQRFPGGVTGDEIYQKRVPKHAPEWLQTCRIMFPSGRHADAMRTQSVADVAWAATQGTVTFHPWHARAMDTDHPDELRIDLDPQPGTTFEDARFVALEYVQPLLAELGFTGFPKTSGNRGVHIYVRIEPRWTFTEVRHAAIALAREIERRADGRVTTAWWKEERGEQIFVDYNQNARDRTIASAYSVRRNPAGWVSAPLTWDELPDAKPADFTMVTMPPRFATLGDLHSAIDDHSYDISLLLEWYERDEADKGLADMPYPPNYPKMPGEPMRVQPSRAKTPEPEAATE